MKKRSITTILYIIVLSMIIMCSSLVGCGNKEEAVDTPDGKSEIKLNINKIDINVDETYKLSATVNDKYKSMIIFWSSNDSTVATVSDDGLITGISTGSTIIVAQCGTDKALCKVTISPAVAGETLSVNLPSDINKDEINITVGDSYKLPFVVKYGETTLKDSDYTIDASGFDSNVISFNAGEVSGVESGSSQVLVTISYKVCENTKTAQILIKVFVN